jgi:hypothetical protein
MGKLGSRLFLQVAKIHKPQGPGYAARPLLFTPVDIFLLGGAAIAIRLWL